MPVVGRLDQYAALVATEFDETTANNIGVTGLSTFYSSEFSENVGVTTITANIFAPYDIVYDDFAGAVYGPGRGRYMRHNTDKSAIIYTEIDEITQFDPISATVTPSVSTLNEGSSVTFTIATTNFTSGTLYWTLNSLSGTLTGSDFSGGAIQGTVTITSSSGSVSLTLANDTTLEGTESFQLLLRKDTFTGNVVGTSSVVTIQDTSTPPSAGVFASTRSVAEGSSVTFSIYTNNFSSGTLYWTIYTAAGTIVAADFSPAALSGSFTITSGSGSVTLSVASDSTDPGDKFLLEVRTDSITGTIIGRSDVIEITEPPASLYSIALGTKAPVYGAGGGTYPPTGSWTGLQNASADDRFVTINIPFTFTFNSTGYTTTYMGSNTYLTFGSGSSAFNGLSASNPALNKFMFGASDNSFQRVSSFASGTNYVRIRYEGNGSTSGTVGSPGITLEITLFNPSLFGNKNVLELLVGNHNRTGGVANVANTSTAYATYTQAANQSYVFEGNSTGTSWTIYTGYYVSGTDY